MYIDPYILCQFSLRPSLSLHYSVYHPLKIIRGEGAFLFDENDQRYLDCINNVAIGGLAEQYCTKQKKKCSVKVLIKKEQEIITLTAQLPVFSNNSFCPC